MKRIAILLLVFTGACAGPAPRALSELTVVDSMYVEPTTGEPYSGPVFRTFSEDSEQVQIEGALLEGEWHGEMTVFHPNGRIRYMGSFVMGQRCGPWTENSDSLPPVNLYDELVREIESMGLYPPCS